MRYRQFGKTGFHISALGFGAMRLPRRREDSAEKIDEDLSVAMMRRAFDLGVNYVDTAWGNMESQSERIVGIALKGWRDRVRVSTVRTGVHRCPPRHGEPEGIGGTLLHRVQVLHAVPERCQYSGVP